MISLPIWGNEKNKKRDITTDLNIYPKVNYNSYWNHSMSFPPALRARPTSWKTPPREQLRGAN